MKGGSMDNREAVPGAGIFGECFGKVKPGMCRLTAKGQVAVKVGNVYKSYDAKTDRLINNSNFVFDIGDDFFFVLPTKKVKPGDIILIQTAEGVRPRCVKEVQENRIIAINYENQTEEVIIPERHVFMGNAYFYSKIVSLFGGKMFKESGNKLLEFMMMSQMFKGKGTGSGGTMDAMLPFMLMNGNLFEGMLDDEEE